MESLELFRDLITGRHREIARRRIIDGGNIATRRDLSPEDKKLVLLLVHDQAPLERLSLAEEAILRGVDKDTITKYLKELGLRR